MYEGLTGKAHKADFQGVHRHCAGDSLVNSKKQRFFDLSGRDTGPRCISAIRRK